MRRRRALPPTAKALLVLIAAGSLACRGGGDVSTLDPLEQEGERFFRDGTLTSGEIVTATVLGDVPVTGSQVVCTSCHGRSGMGASESGSRTPPIAGPFLFSPEHRTYGTAYTDETLTLAMREGVDPDGRSLDPLMPRYPLVDADADALLAYLHHLGTAPSPGADQDNLHLATVLADDVPEEVREAVVDVLEAFVEDKNSEVRNEGARSRERREEDRVIAPYRVWTLDVWTVTGRPARWRAQLERHYRERPVFALVSGMAEGSWQPVHDFCEERAIPCLLPNVDLPPDPQGDFYSLYYSGGLPLEARILAEDLARAGAGSDVLQLVGEGDATAAAAARELEGLLSAAGGTSRIEEAGPGTRGDAVLSQALSSPASAVVLWLQSGSLERLEQGAQSAAPIYLSGTLLDGSWEGVPESLRSRARVVDLFRLPTERDPGLARFHLWAKRRGVEVTHEREQAQAWFAFLTTVHGVKHTEKYLGRDYLLDSLEHSSGLGAYLPIYARGSFGLSQRTLAKGGQVVDLTGADEPRWIVP